MLEVEEEAIREEIKRESEKTMIGNRVKLYSVDWWALRCLAVPLRPEHASTDTGALEVVTEVR